MSEEIITRLRAEIERLAHERDRWKDVAERQANWEELWAEQVAKANAAERKLAIAVECLNRFHSCPDTRATLAEMEKADDH